MLEIVDKFVGTIASVARGDIDPGAAMLEQGLADSVPVAIGFLANQVGLGNVSDKIAEIVGGVREVVDSALDWLMDQAEAALQSILKMLGFGGAKPAEPVAADLDPTDHESVATHAVKDLEQGTVAGDYAAVRAQKEAQAREIEQKYTPMLQPGIALTITFSSPKTDAEDEDLDFSVVIAPNTIKVSASLPVAVPGPATGSGAAVKAKDPIVVLDEDRGTFVQAADQVIKLQEGEQVRGLWIPIPKGGRRLLLYKDYKGEPGGEDTWEISPVPIYVMFHASGTTSRGGLGGRVIIDMANFNKRGTRGKIPVSAYVTSSYDPAGKWSEGGHLVAFMFGGPGGWTSGNIVPMTKNANATGIGMPKVENPVRDDININLAVYDYNVQAKYDNSQLPPYEIEVTLSRLYPSPKLPPGLSASTSVDNR